MSDFINAARQAREALETCTPGDYSTGHVIHPSFDEKAVEAAIAALDTALAKVQEPVAWQDVHCQTDLYLNRPAQVDVRPLYAAPLAPADTVKGKS